MGYEIDHKNGNGLDNRMENLRLATRAENQMNRNVNLNNNQSSKYKGVTWHKKCKKWMMQIRKDSKNQDRDKRLKIVAIFDLEKDAALSYDYHAVQLFGEYARLNFAIQSKDIYIIAWNNRVTHSNPFYGVYKYKTKWKCFDTIKQKEIF